MPKFITVTNRTIFDKANPPMDIKYYINVDNINSIYSSSIKLSPMDYNSVIVFNDYSVNCIETLKQIMEMINDKV